jgi:hypothetical protein
VLSPRCSPRVRHLSLFGTQLPLLEEARGFAYTRLATGVPFWQRIPLLFPFRFPQSGSLSSASLLTPNWLFSSWLRRPPQRVTENNNKEK